MISIESEERPWGRFYVLHDEPTYKLKRIEVDPGGRLSYQYRATPFGATRPWCRRTPSSTRPARRALCIKSNSESGARRRGRDD